MNKPLSVQADQLKRSLQNRQRRRTADRAQRANAAEGEGFDVYDDKPRSRGPREGGVAALASVAAMSAMSSVQLLRCEVCKATFVTDAQLQQHLGSSVHHKAVMKREAAQQERQRLVQFNDVAQAALAAAAWHAAQGGGERESPHPTSTHSSTGAAGPSAPAISQHSNASRAIQQTTPTLAPTQSSHRTRRTNGPTPSNRPASNLLSHEQLLAQAKAVSEPLSIDGWVPPSLTASTSLPVHAVRREVVDRVLPALVDAEEHSNRAQQQQSNHAQHHDSKHGQFQHSNRAQQQHSHSAQHQQNMLNQESNSGEGNKDVGGGNASPRLTNSVAVQSNRHVGESVVLTDAAQNNSCDRSTFANASRQNNSYDRSAFVNANRLDNSASSSVGRATSQPRLGEGMWQDNTQEAEAIASAGIGEGAVAPEREEVEEGLGLAGLVDYSDDEDDDDEDRSGTGEDEMDIGPVPLDVGRGAGVQQGLGGEEDSSEESESDSDQSGDEYKFTSFF